YAHRCQPIARLSSSSYPFDDALGQSMRELVKHGLVLRAFPEKHSRTFIHSKACSGPDRATVSTSPLPKRSQPIRVADIIRRRLNPIFIGFRGLKAHPGQSGVVVGFVLPSTLCWAIFSRAARGTR